MATLESRVATLEELQQLHERSKPPDLAAIYAKLGIANVGDTCAAAHSAGKSVADYLGITRKMFNEARESLARKGKTNVNT